MNYGLADNELRHNDHKFEWSREEVRAFLENIYRLYGYSFTLQGVGEMDEKTGAQPSHLIVLRKGA